MKNDYHTFVKTRILVEKPWKLMRLIIKAIFVCIFYIALPTFFFERQWLADGWFFYNFAIGLNVF